MRTTARGLAAETAVAEHLKSQGWEILQRNWRTRICEIDLVAKHRGIIYFVEVKYRGSASQGGGLAAITPAKQKRLRFSAQVWASHHGWEGDQRLVVASVTADGQGYRLEELVELD